MPLDPNPETPSKPKGAPAAREETSFQGIVHQLGKYWPLLSSGTAVAVFVFFFGEARTAFDNYVRSVVYPGLQSVSDDQVKSTEERYMTTAKYLRHVVIPSVEFPGNGTAQYEKRDDIKNVDAKYKKELQNATTKLLFDTEKFDETLVAWFQKSIQTYINAQKSGGTGPVSVGNVLADNHTVVTDWIVGGVYSGNVRLSRDNPDYTVPILVPVEHSVRLIYSIQGQASTTVYATVSNRDLKKSDVQSVNLEQAGTANFNLTEEFARVRKLTGSSTDLLQGDFFYVRLGYNREEQAKLERTDHSAIQKSGARSTVVDEQPIVIVYALVVDKGIQMRWKK
jgi:hypothetical protein